MTREDEYINVMDAMFKGLIDPNVDKPEPKMVELGHGIGVGHRYGSFTEYMAQLSEKRENNRTVYLGKDINTNNNVLSIVSPTDEFTVGDIPKALVMSYNVINKILTKAAWKYDDTDDTILEQYYEIPYPRSMGYDWWDSYGVYFMGPEDLKEGKYKVEIMSREICPRNIKTLTCTMDFTIINKKQEIKNSSTNKN